MDAVNENENENEMTQSVKVAIILGQTTYTEEQCVSLLEEYKGDYISVIKIFMGIPIVKKVHVIKSINQEIYKQFRQKLDIQQLPLGEGLSHT